MHCASRAVAQPNAQLDFGDKQLIFPSFWRCVRGVLSAVPEASISAAAAMRAFNPSDSLQ